MWTSWGPTCDRAAVATVVFAAGGISRSQRRFPVALKLAYSLELQLRVAVKEMTWFRFVGEDGQLVFPNGLQLLIRPLGGLAVKRNGPLGHHPAQTPRAGGGRFVVEAAGVDFVRTLLQKTSWPPSIASELARRPYSSRSPRATTFWLGAVRTAGLPRASIRSSARSSEPAAFGGG